MKYHYVIKLVAILIVSLVLLVALGSIEYKVFERGQYQAEAKASIANGWSGRQLVVSPLMRIAWRQHYTEEIFDKNLERYVTKQRSRTWTELRLPDTLSIKSNVLMQERSLGIYTIPVYETDLQLHGTFDYSVQLPQDTSITKVELLTSFSDMRGISKTPTINWNGVQIQFEPGDDLHLLGNYIAAELPVETVLKAGEFRMQTRLRGLDAIHFVPTARHMTAELTSEWPHPYFQGRYLPVARDISTAGFNARWELTEFATSIQSAINQCGESPSQCANTLNMKAFGVGFHNPIDVYQKTDRSLKYGFLLIALTFAAFLLIEVIRRIRIHPIQYGFVGCALAIFYLLLISLSEQLSFLLSYAIAAACCVVLIGFYLRFVLKSTAQAVAMASGLGLLYAMLYVILKSEDSALLMGTALTFLSLAALMVVTREIDWYQLFRSSQSERGQANVTS